MSRDPIYILGVDPGTTSGWALLCLPTTGPVIHSDHGQCHPQDIPRILHRIFTPVHGYLTVEGQWLAKDSGQGQKHRAHAVDTIGLARAAGEWRGAARMMGWELMDPIPPNTWRRALLGHRVAPKSSDAWKAWAIGEVALRYGLAIPPARHHEAEAILIATYAAGVLRMKGVTL